MDDDYIHKLERCLLLGSKAMTNLDSILKSRDIILLTKVHLVKAMFFSSNHVQMWVSDHTEAWVPNNWCFQTVVLEKTLESPLHCKEIKPVNPRGNQPRTFIGRADAEAEASVIWPPDAKSQLIGKDPHAGKEQGQEEKGTTENEILDSIRDSMDMNLSKLQEIAEDRGAWHAIVHGVLKSQTCFRD